MLVWPPPANHSAGRSQICIFSEITKLFERQAAKLSQSVVLTLFYKILDASMARWESHLKKVTLGAECNAPTPGTRCSPRTHAGVDDSDTPANSYQYV